MYVMCEHKYIIVSPGIRGVPVFILESRLTS